MDDPLNVNSTAMWCYVQLITMTQKAFLGSVRRNVRKALVFLANVVIESDKQGPMSPQTLEFSHIYSFTPFPHLSETISFTLGFLTNLLLQFTSFEHILCTSFFHPRFVQFIRGSRVGFKRNFISKQCWQFFLRFCLFWSGMI